MVGDGSKEIRSTYPTRSVLYANFVSPGTAISGTGMSTNS